MCTHSQLHVVSHKKMILCPDEQCPIPNLEQKWTTKHPARGDMWYDIFKNIRRALFYVDFKTIAPHISGPSTNRITTSSIKNLRLSSLQPSTMKSFSLSSFTLGLATLASLSVATPTIDSEPLEVTTSNSTSLGKREDLWHFCGDSTWKSFGERAFLAGIRLMGRIDDHQMKLTEASRDEIPDQYFGTSGKCTNLWCGGDWKKGRGVVFYLCLKPETPDTFYNSGDLAQKFHDGFHDCNNKREPQDDKDQTALAYHVWADGYDLHVEGGYVLIAISGSVMHGRIAECDEAVHEQIE